MSETAYQAQTPDVSTVDPNECTAEEWTALTTAVHSGEEVEVSHAAYWYFLEALPPRAILGRGRFIYAEGATPPTLFRAVEGKFYARTFPIGDGGLEEAYRRLAAVTGLEGSVLGALLRSSF